MILRQLKTYMANQKMANILEISRFLKVDVMVARDLLQVLQRRGCVCRSEPKKNCGTVCQKCNSLTTEVYCWKE